MLSPHVTCMLSPHITCMLSTPYSLRQSCSQLQQNPLMMKMWLVLHDSYCQPTWIPFLWSFKTQSGIHTCMYKGGQYEDMNYDWCTVHVGVQCVCICVYSYHIHSMWMYTPYLQCTKLPHPPPPIPINPPHSVHMYSKAQVKWAGALSDISVYTMDTGPYGLCMSIGNNDDEEVVDIPYGKYMD